MSVIITANKLNTRDNLVPSPETKPDGSGYPWRMFYNGNQMIADMDTTGEALEVLIPGYIAGTDEQRLSDRVQLAETVQTLAKATILADISAEDDAKLAPWEKEVLFFSGDPYGWGSGENPVGSAQDDDNFDLWSQEIPLVLVNTSYAPFTEIIKPVSSEGDYEEVKNIIWLRPDNELSFLNSLSRIGYITFGVPQHMS